VRVLLHGAVDLSLAGGVETHLRELARGLAARGHEVDILGRPAELAPFRMVSRIDPARYDVLHDHSTSWPRGIARGGRYVRTAHFCTAAKMAVYLRRGRIRTLANAGNWRAVLGERAAARAGARWIAVSERLRGELVQWNGVPPERVVTIPNGASFATPVRSRDEVRRAWDVPADAFVALAVGRHDFVKGFDLFGRAWQRARRPERGLWVTVGGERRARTSSTLITGPLPREQMFEWIHAADLGVFPSYYEGCGIVLIDMRAAGLPVLTHDVGIAGDVVEPGVDGEIVPMREDAWVAALERCFARPPARTRTLPAGASWERMVERVEEVYREMMQP
jgi:glycosyltransferase involved in cell wall biosynthesis